MTHTNPIQQDLDILKDFLLEAVESENQDYYVSTIDNVKITLAVLLEACKTVLELGRLDNVLKNMLKQAINKIEKGKK